VYKNINKWLKIEKWLLMHRFPLEDDKHKLENEKCEVHTKPFYA
jgi:hypothetical protein